MEHFSIWSNFWTAEAGSLGTSSLLMVRSAGAKFAQMHVKRLGGRGNPAKEIQKKLKTKSMKETLCLAGQELVDTYDHLVRSLVSAGEKSQDWDMDTVPTSVNDLLEKVSAVEEHNQKMQAFHERMKQEQALVRVAQFKQKKVLEQSMKKITKQFTDNGIPANMVKWMSADLQVVEIDQDGL